MCVLQILDAPVNLSFCLKWQVHLCHKHTYCLPSKAQTFICLSFKIKSACTKQKWHILHFFYEYSFTFNNKVRTCINNSYCCLQKFSNQSFTCQKKNSNQTFTCQKKKSATRQLYSVMTKSVYDYTSSSIMPSESLFNKQVYWYRNTLIPQVYLYRNISYCCLDVINRFLSFYTSYYIFYYVRTLLKLELRSLCCIPPE